MTRPRLSVVIAALAASTHGCEPVPSGTNYCETNADCRIGKVCDLYDHECINEASDAFLGTFRCTVVAAGGTVTDPGYSDVVGWFNNQRFALNQEAQCSLKEGKLSVFVLKHVTPTQTVYANLGFTGLSTTETQDAVSGGLGILDSSSGQTQWVGALIQGEGTFNEHVNVGSTLTGYLLFGFNPL